MLSMKTLTCARLIVVAAGVLTAFYAVAQPYPARPLRILQGFAPGGNGDAIARIVGDEISKTLRQPVVVEARPGAGGTIGADLVAKATPDGYTLFLMTGGHVVAGALYRKLPYDTVAGFAMLSTVTFFPFLVVTRADSKWLTMNALIAEMKAAPKPLAFGSAGIGSTHHLIGELMAATVGAKILHVPYKGDSAALSGMLANEVPFIIAPPTAVIGHIQAGTLKALATTGRTRWQRLPDVPTIDESAIPGFAASSWIGLAATAGSPRVAVERLNAEINRAVRVPEVKSRLEDFGGEVRGSTTDEMQRHVASELARWQQVVRDARIPQQ